MSNVGSNATLDGVAIIGMAGRFPGARNIGEFWRNLLAGVESISRFDRHDLEASVLEDPGARDQPGYVPARGVLDGVDLFDADFFGINPKEAQILDPQQRLFLEAAWEALERAGYDPATAGGSVGVFAGMSNNSYFAANLKEHRDLIDLVGALQTMMGNEKDYLATRVSYKLDLKGPSVSVQTACSTSLVAVCQAVQSLLAYQCDMALAGGVSIALPQKRGYLPYDGGITSADGHCRAFDAQAQGTVFSNGLGVVVLKRLADAVADGDHVCAVIKGSALNNDGSGKVSFLAPSVDGHAEAVAMAQAYAQVDARSISYVEAHGTGTALGDVVEVAALTQAFRSQTADTGFCALGSVKTNIGHLDVAAGVAALIKAVLSLQHRIVPPSLHFTSPNPKLSLEKSPFFVNTSPLEWAAGATPRRAGVSSLGVGGTNAHVVLEEAPVAEASDAGRGTELVVLSARTASALERVTENALDFLEGHPDASLADVAYTLQVGRRRFAHRRAVVCRDRGDAIRALRERPGRRLLTGDLAANDTTVAFMFPGGVTPAPGCGQALFDREPVFRAAIGECASALGRDLDVDLRDVLYPASDSRAAGDVAPAVAQAALFAVEYALARLWMHWGAVPAVVVGDGAGEVVAAVIAGVFSVKDALGLIVRRARLQASARTASNADMDAFASAVRQIERKAPKVAMAASGSGEWVSAEQAVDPEYWAKTLLKPCAELDLRGLQARSPLVLLTVAPPQADGSGPQAGRDGAAMTILPTLGRGRGDIESMFDTLAYLWLHGVEVNWRAVHDQERRARVPLPTYPFERERYWIDPAPAAAYVARTSQPADATDVVDEVAAPEAPAADVSPRLVTLFSELSGLREAQLDRTMNFFELGLDSLFLTQAAAAIQKTFSVKITFRELLEELTTIESLAERVTERLPVVPVAPRPAVSPAASRRAAASAAPADLDPILRQLDALRAQVESLRAGGAASAPASSSAPAPRPVRAPELASEPEPSPLPSRGFGPIRPERGQTGVSAEQRRQLEQFIEAYVARTTESKRLTATHRDHLADPRSVAGFRAIWKEMVYPIVTARSAGSKLWDVDGNEYVDLVNGFGTNLLGHSPSFVREALEAQLKLGVEIGPQSPLAGPVAAMAAEMTGHQRVAFCNTGSEAVTAAIRMARTVSGRDRIAMFAGAYHGTFDEVLVRGTTSRGELRSVPIAPGIVAGACENILVLDYGSSTALDILRAEGPNLAAVLVEPVQSRRPELQPVKFLHDLRQITRDSGTALVFDEVVTGFRVHPGGAQALFGIKPELASYGKVVGGGMPIGLVAGDATYLDALDGGHWSYGDGSFPEVGMTFFAGTFVRHPLALAAARAVLTHLKAEGPELQRRLNLRTTALVDTLKARAAELKAPVSITHFSSWFCFNFPSELPLAPLFFAYMRHKGVHLWEGRPGFITTAHSDADVARVIDVFTETLVEMQQAGFLPAPEPAEPPVPGARRGRHPDGREGWFMPDPDRPGRYVEVSLA
jgi:acyl transferase domain-containing protein/glutamate-1-semialdehyde aminotransferase